MENAETLRGIVCFKKICQGIHPHASLLNLKIIQITLHSHTFTRTNRRVNVGYIWAISDR